MKAIIFCFMYFSIVCLAAETKTESIANPNPSPDLELEAELNGEIPDNILTVKEKSIHLNSIDNELYINFDVEVIDGFFAYEDKFKIEIQDFVAKSIDIDPVVSFYDKTFQKNKKGVKDKAHIKIQVQYTGEIIPNQLNFSLTYQTCTPEYCLFPNDLQITHLLDKPSKELLTMQTGPNWLNQGIFLSLLFVFFAGFLTSLTPCVYPMLPITIAVLGANKSKSRLEGFFKSLTYVFGMALTYAFLGLFVASTGFMFGSLLSNYYFLGFLSLVLFLGALSMFDIFEIRTPAFLTNNLNVKQSSTSYIALFITGLFSGLMVGPCVGPVLIGVLGYVSQTKSLFQGFFLLFFFALGLGSLILVLGTFSNLLEKIPRSGTWMVYVKKALGLLFLGLIFYFISPVLTVRQTTYVTLLVLSLFTIVILIKSQASKNLNLNLIEDSAYKTVFIFSLIFGLIIFSLSEERFERLVGYSNETYINTNWDVFTDEKLNIAKENQKFVIVDFYAQWCAACRELKNKTFSKSEIINFSPEIKWLYFDSTKSSKKLDELKARFNILGLPTILFFDSNGKIRNDLRLTGFEKPSEFIKRLQKLTNREKNEKNI